MIITNDEKERFCYASALSKVATLCSRKIEEEKDKFVCYIEESEVRNLSAFNTYFYFGWLFDYKTEGNKELFLLGEQGVEKTTKPTCYIFDGITFYTGVYIDAEPNNGIVVIFKNCIFKAGILINNIKEIVFENNIYFNIENGENGYILNENGILTKHFLTINNNVKKVTFINEIFKIMLGHAPYPLYYTTGFGMSIKANEVEILASSIETNFPSDISAKSVKLLESSITGPEFSIDADSFTNENSTINAITGLIIDNKNCDFKGNIESQLVIYNGEDITERSPNGITITKCDPSLKSIRQDLIYKLREIKSRVFPKTIGDIMQVNPNTRKKVPQR